MSELTFEQMLEESFKTIHTGEVVEGTVIDVKPEEIILNIGYKSDQVKHWQAFSGGMGNAFEGAVDVKKLTANPFEGGTFNLAEGKFIPNANYSGYGAKR